MFRVETTEDSRPPKTGIGYIVGFSGSLGMIDAQVLVAMQSGELRIFVPSELKVTNLDLFDFEKEEE